jgi:hypothetical protein
LSKSDNSAVEQLTPQPKADTTDKKSKYEKRKEEWREVEALIMRYQAQFINPDQKEDANKAMEELLQRFFPLFKKYLVLLKSGQINFNDTEMKHFVHTFMAEGNLKAALKRKKQSAAARAPIYQRFNFIKETYGSLDEDEIMMDLQTLFVVLARRYKQMGKSFCGYLYNAYYHEVSRHIKSFIKNPANIHYRNSEYEDYMQKSVDEFQKEDIPFDERLFEDEGGIPDSSWINGETCSETFEMLTPLERRLLVKYYLEDYNDRQVAERFGMHINTVNQKRRFAAEEVANALGKSRLDIKRNRKSGKRPMMIVIK